MLGASSYHVKPHSLEKLRVHLKILHEYWMTCETPEVDRTGRQLHTDSEGKLGERFEQATTGAPFVMPPPENKAGGLSRAWHGHWLD